eukprot:TRINITY_DN5451_c0_g1_i1.p1 TRINITY_DN5451_c0_g1~~TRINITY_DN5451_c0_g1_i1.p1  ORF type:complete len:190 (-),score=53.72 TRINITY_DN5451_c0_g1_i1:93-662(-)
MGNITNKKSSISKVDISHLSEIDTEFSEEELVKIFRNFKKEVSSNVIEQKTFLNVLKAMGIDNEFIQMMVFNAFDRGRTGEVTFEDFATVLSQMTRGSPDAKLRLAFDMFDINGDGEVSRDEIAQVIGAIYNVAGPILLVNGKRYDDIEQFVDELFDEFDLEGRGFIDFEQYKQAATKNPNILQALKLF